MMANAAHETGEEVRLRRSALTVIGRHLGAMYDDVVTGEIPAGLTHALERLRACDDDSTRR